MEPGQPAQLEHILQHMSVGVAILDCSDLRLQYANPFLLSLLEQLEPSWRPQAVVGHCLDEIIPDELRRIAIPLLQQVCSTGERLSWSDMPFEGFLAARGRTYWRVSIERASNAEEQLPAEIRHADDTLLITIEDVTELARSRLYVNAIDSITSAIAGPFALPQVLDRILHAVQEMVGSTRCAVLLIDHSVSGREFRYSNQQRHTEPAPTVTIAAQKGVHLRSQDWRPQLSEQLLLGHVVRDRHTLVITDTSTLPEMDFPLLDDGGTPRRPGSVLCIPIFEPTAGNRAGGFLSSEKKGRISPGGAVLGTIEIYHRRARGFPAEEVELLEQFAQQAGLAIQNARLFLRIDQLAKDASRNLRQREYIMQAIPDGVIIYDSRWRVVEANQSIRRLLGWTNDVIGLHITEALAKSKAIFSQDYKSKVNFVSELDERTRVKLIDEVKLTSADGQHYTLSRSYAPIHDELGDVFASVVIYHDVTERVLARERIEAEVIERTAQLAQRNAALELARFAQDMARERMELLLERLPSGVILISAGDRSISIINRQATQILQNLGVPIEPLDDLDAATRNAVGGNAEELLRMSTVYASSG